MSVGSRPTPLITPDDDFYWAGLRNHEVLLQRCVDCARARFPAMPSCPYCAGSEAEVVPAAGGYRVYTWVTARRAFDEAFADDVPYTVLTVTLSEGCRMIGWFDGPVEALSDGLDVEPAFVEQEGWTELRFRLPSARAD